MTTTLRGFRRWAVILGFAAVLAVGAFLALGGFGQTCACSPQSPVDGVVTQVEATGLTEIQGFTIRISGGTTARFVIGPLENATEFPPGHLKEHQASGSPVRVYFTTTGSTLTAYRLEDAPGSSSSP